MEVKSQHNFSSFYLKSKIPDIGSNLRWLYITEWSFQLYAVPSVETYSKYSHEKCIMITNLLVLIVFGLAMIYEVVTFSSS